MSKLIIDGLSDEDKISSEDINRLRLAHKCIKESHKMIKKNFNEQKINKDNEDFDEAIKNYYAERESTNKKIATNEELENFQNRFFMISQEITEFFILKREDFLVLSFHN